MIPIALVETEGEIWGEGIMLARILVAGLALAFGGCVTTTEVTKVWVRTDGRSIKSDKALSQQYDIDSTICKGETEKSAVGMAPIYYTGLAGAIAASQLQAERVQLLEGVAEGCMASKGYLRVPEADADGKAKELRGTFHKRRAAG